MNAIDSKNLPKPTRTQEGVKKEKGEGYTKDRETEFTCSDCGEVFASKSWLTSHMPNMHVGSEDSCQLCGEKFALRNDLGNHTEKAHANRHEVGEYLYQLCDEKFSLKKELKSHTENAHTKEADECSECEKNYQSRKYLTSHIRTVHTLQPSLCPKGKAEIKNTRYLCQHLQRAHSSDSESAKHLPSNLMGNLIEVITPGNQVHLLQGPSDFSLTLQSS